MNWRAYINKSEQKWECLRYSNAWKCSYRYVGESTTSVWCPDVFSVRVPNNGGVLAAAIGHQVIHVGLPGHACVLVQMKNYFLIERRELSGKTVARKRLYKLPAVMSPTAPRLRRVPVIIWVWAGKRSHRNQAATGCSPYEITPRSRC